MNKRTVTPGDASLLAREVNILLQAAEILDGEPQQMPLYWAAQRLAGILQEMTESLERGGTYGQH